MKFTESQLEAMRTARGANGELQMMRDELNTSGMTPDSHSEFSTHNSSFAKGGEFILYTSEDGQSRVECRFEGEALWLSQALMAELFEMTPQNITRHLKSLYEDGEIDGMATCKDYLQVRQEGSRKVRRSVEHYNFVVLLQRIGDIRLPQFISQKTANPRS